MARSTEQTRSGSRTRARRLAMQAVYQWLLNDSDAGDIEQQFLEDPESASANREYLIELIRGVIGAHELLVELITPHIDRSLNEVDPVERAVLLVAAYELKQVLSVPYRAVINEAVELSKTYGAEQGHKFINGVLDKLAHNLRPHES